MKTLVVFMSLLCQLTLAQKNWEDISLPDKNVNLKTLSVDENGDIYVFGEKGAAFRRLCGSNEWEKLPLELFGVDWDILKCALDKEVVYIGGNDKVYAFKKALFNWIDALMAPHKPSTPKRIFKNYFRGELESIGHKTDSPVYFFECDTGISFVFDTIKTIGRDDYTFPRAFILPHADHSNEYLYLGYWDAQEASNRSHWNTRLANKGRVITFVSQYGLWKTFYSDKAMDWHESEIIGRNENDRATSWEFFVDASFSGEHGYLLLTHHGGYGFYLFESNDNGQSYHYIDYYYGNYKGDGFDKFSQEDSYLNATFRPRPIGAYNFKGNLIAFGQWINWVLSKTSDGKSIWEPIREKGFIQTRETYEETDWLPNYVTGNSKGLIVAAGDSGAVYIYHGFENIKLEEKLIKNDKGIICYPNPINDNFTIYSEKSTTVELINASGITVKKYHIVIGENRLDIGAKSGIYLLKDSDQKMTTKIVVKRT